MSESAIDFLQRRDRGLIERGGRTLGRRIVGANGLDRVADELETNRLPGAGGKEVDDAAAHAELAVLVDRILSRVAGGREQVSEIGRRNVVARRQRQRNGAQFVPAD